MSACRNLSEFVTSHLCGGRIKSPATASAIVKLMESLSTSAQNDSSYSRSSLATRLRRTGRWRTSTSLSSSGGYVPLENGASSPSRSLSGTTARLLVLDDLACESE